MSKTKTYTSSLNKPQIGLSMLFCLGEAFPSLLKYLQKVDVRYVEIVDEGLHTLNSRRVKALRKVAQSKDLDVAVHAPFSGINIAVPSPVLRRAILKRLKKSIFYAGQLDCRLWLFHPGLQTGISHFYPGRDWQLNLDSVRALLKISRKEGVEIAIENVPESYPFILKSVQDFSRFYDELNDDIGLVLDVAHANLNRQIQDFIRRFSEKIVHIHVSDNDGASDSHLGIGYGTINWESVAKAVKESKYSNVIMLESIEHVEESLQTLRKLFT
ncbi:MAG: endonuclease IV [Candidatus Bathyarchaeota archaeon BA2]|nr:MAG: endonuclease IV [Candidatus Bathyarchaeota archaeon BA2]